MKFCLKQKIVTNPPPTDKIEKVSGVTEYEALRAEKLFRYEYSNQLNTSLLTFAFTVIIAGLVLFSLVMQFGDLGENQKTISFFIEYFFAAFFLLPCFFAGINFRYTVKNSLRICQITDYVRIKIQFDDDESWESFKQDYNAHYFYKQSCRIGGAKDIPLCVSIVSCAISFAVFCIFTYLCNKNAGLGRDEGVFTFWYWAARSFVFLSTAIITQLLPFKNKKRYYVIILLLNITITSLFFSTDTISYRDYFLMELVWAELFNFCLYLMPQFNREIKIADLFLDFTKTKLQFSAIRPHCNKCTKKQREMTIFEMFLRNNSFIYVYLQKGKFKCKTRKYSYLKQYLHELFISNTNLSKKEMQSLLKQYVERKLI